MVVFLNLIYRMSNFISLDLYQTPNRFTSLTVQFSLLVKGDHCVVDWIYTSFRYRHVHNGSYMSCHLIYFFYYMSLGNAIKWTVGASLLYPHTALYSIVGHHGSCVTLYIAAKIGSQNLVLMNLHEAGETTLLPIKMHVTNKYSSITMPSPLFL